MDGCQRFSGQLAAHAAAPREGTGEAAARLVAASHDVETVATDNITTNVVGPIGKLASVHVDANRVEGRISSHSRRLQRLESFWLLMLLLQLWRWRSCVGQPN